MSPADLYSMSVHWYPGDEAYVALCPEFPLLSALGETREEAIAELRTVITAVIAVEQEAGTALPTPSFAPEPRPPSGEFRPLP